MATAGKDKGWVEMTPAEQLEAGRLGWNEELWYAVHKRHSLSASPSRSSPHLREVFRGCRREEGESTAACETRWAAMSEGQREAAALLGYDEEAWDAELELDEEGLEDAQNEEDKSPPQVDSAAVPPAAAAAAAAAVPGAPRALFPARRAAAPHVPKRDTHHDLRSRDISATVRDRVAGLISGVLLRCRTEPAPEPEPPAAPPSTPKRAPKSAAPVPAPAPVSEPASEPPAATATGEAWGGAGAAPGSGAAAPWQPSPSPAVEFKPPPAPPGSCKQHEQSTPQTRRPGMALTDCAT